MEARSPGAPRTSHRDPRARPPPREKRVTWAAMERKGCLPGWGAVPVLWSREREGLRALLPQAWAAPTQEGAGKAASLIGRLQLTGAPRPLPLFPVFTHSPMA